MIGAIAASLVAPFVRGELVVIPIMFAIAGVFVVWTSDWGTHRRSSWSWDDYLGVYALALGAIFAISGLASHHSQQWYGVTVYWKHRAIVLGDWAAGALAIGMGVIPFVVGLAALFAVRGEERSRELRIFRNVAVAGDHRLRALHGHEGGLPVDRRSRRASRSGISSTSRRCSSSARRSSSTGAASISVALAAAAAYGFYLVVGTPLQMGVQLYSDALGFSILQQANRYYELTPAGAQWLLIGILLGGVALVVLTMQRTCSARSRRPPSRRRSRSASSRGT